MLKLWVRKSVQFYAENFRLSKPMTEVTFNRRWLEIGRHVFGEVLCSTVPKISKCVPIPFPHIKVFRDSVNTCNLYVSVHLSVCLDCQSVCQQTDGRTDRQVDIQTDG